MTDPITQDDLELLPEEVRQLAQRYILARKNLAFMDDHAIVERQSLDELFSAIIASQKELATAKERVGELEEHKKLLDQKAEDKLNKEIENSGYWDAPS